MEKRRVRSKKLAWELKEMDSKQIIFKMKLFASIFIIIFFYFKWLLMLTMLSTQS